MGDIRQQEGKSGFVGGAAQRQRRTASRVGRQQQTGLIQQREQGMQSVEESIGMKLGQLEGTLLDFLGSQAQMALNIKSFDPDGSSNSSEEYGTGPDGMNMGNFNYNDFLDTLRTNIGGQYGG